MKKFFKSLWKWMSKPWVMLIADVLVFALWVWSLVNALGDNDAAGSAISGAFVALSFQWIFRDLGKWYMAKRDEKLHEEFRREFEANLRKDV